MSILSSPDFLNLFSQSGSADESRGMKKIEFKTSSASLVTFDKSHSYGEYIFDWAWADAFKKHRIAYYPKLTSMTPYTPATAAHFIGEKSQWKDLLKEHDELLLKYSSAHFLFTTNEEQLFLGDNGYLLRDSFQYHFFNEDYQNFDDFLGHLKTKKAKNIRLERLHPNLVIEPLTRQNLTKEHAHEMYEFYLMTIKEKGAIAYLTKEFFELLFTKFPENTLYVRAKRDNSLIAGALFYYDKEKIYGRYWGSREYVPNLHFELCYYQGIDFCIENKLKIFEAGAQGEHKIARGFRPIITTSAHKINHQDFSLAISDYIKQEKSQIKEAVADLTKLLPFK